MRWLVPAFCGALLLGGCATTHVSREPLTVQQQEVFLRGLSGFRLDGRTGVTAHGERIPSATVTWRQQAEESRLRLSGPIGAGSLTLIYRPAYLSVTTSRGQELHDGEAEQALAAQLGFLPPFEALRYWALGLVAPGEPPAAAPEVGADGHIVEMKQLQWRIRYDVWTEVATPAGLVRLPRRLTVSRDDLSLRLFVDRWKLGSGN